MCSSVVLVKCSLLILDISRFLHKFLSSSFFREISLSISISRYPYMQLGLSISSSSINSSQGHYGYLTRQVSGGTFACARTRRGSLLNPSLISTSSSSISAHHHVQEVLTTKPRHGGDGENIKGDEGYSSSSIKTHLSNLEKLFPNANRGCLSPLPPPHPSPPADFPINNEQQFMAPFLNKGKDFVTEGLVNLTRRIWLTETNDVVAVGEELSPRNKLNHLQQQLLMSAATTEYSPRNHLGSRWMEYHGSKDWAGLLDPLDENLRREVVRYGEFVQAAYQAFHTNPDAPADERLRHHNPHVALPDSSYKVTKSLYATTSVGLPGWVDNVAPESLEWMTQRSSWIGYVAVCDDKREIERMGRRDIVIALRGTATCLEWVENLKDLLVRIDDDDNVDQFPAKQGQLQAKVECGFWSLYKTSGISNSGSIIPSLSESVTQEVARLMELYKGEKLSITVTGHSLGAALSVLAAEELSRKLPNPPPPIAVFSFGGPRVGNRGLANRIKEKGIVKVLRVVNSQDMITKVPGMFVSEELDHKIRTGGRGSVGSDDDDNNKNNNDKTKQEVGGGLGKVVLDILDNNMPWAYWHVGSELRVDSKRSPYLKPNADVACCHDLEAYLHLVDGFLASDCPFRENAKRSLVRLLTEQGSNVDKKLYTSKPPKAKTEALNLRHLHKGSRPISGGSCAVLLRMPSCLASPS